MHREEGQWGYYKFLLPWTQFGFYINSGYKAEEKH